MSTPTVPVLRSALWLPIFDGLADPAVVARLAAEAEQAGWHGFFVWDHLRWRAPARPAPTWPGCCPNWPGAARWP